MVIADSSKNRAIVLVVTEGGLSPGRAAQRFEVSSRWVCVLLVRYREHAVDGFEPRWRRPHTNPNATSTELRERIFVTHRATSYGPGRWPGIHRCPPP